MNAVLGAGLKAERLVYLDAVRAFAMFFGIFVHGTTIATPYIDQMPIFARIQDTSDLFRVAIFFLVSGFFTALVLRKNTFATYARSRFEVLVIPLVSSMILIVPITNWMIHAWHNGYMSPLDYFTGGWRNPTIGNDTWALHIWFLFSLVIYATLAPLFMRFITSATFQRLLTFYLDRTAGFTIWTNVVIFAAAIVLGRAAYDQGFRYLVDDTPLSWIVRATLFHMPMFLLGMIAFVNRRFLASISVLSPLGLVVFAGLYWGIQAYAADLPRVVERGLHWFIRGGLSVFVIANIIWFFERFLNTPSKGLSFAVDSAYSFYLFHFTFIYMVAWAVAPFTDNLYVIYICIVLFATPLTLLWHALVISKVPLLRFLFTGKRSAKVVVPSGDKAATSL